MRYLICFILLLCLGCCESSRKVTIKVNGEVIENYESYNTFHGELVVYKDGKRYTYGGNWEIIEEYEK